jgi:DNA-binding CsgD family transcriptional regulator
MLRHGSEVERNCFAGGEVEAKLALRSLTPRELEIVQQICTGKGLREVAIALKLAHSTVDNHKSRAYQKLRVHNTAQLMLWALAAGLIESPAATQSRAQSETRSLELRAMRL